MSSRSSLARLLAALVLCVLALGSIARGASATTGDIRGTVVDPNGKPAANVRVTAVAPSGSYNATSDEHGRYALLNVAPDTYSVSFEKQGFDTTIQRGVTVVAGATPTLNAQLQLRTIGGARVVARAPGAFTPNEPIDRISVNETQINTIQAKAFNQDETNLLRSLPSVTVDKSGTVSIRGGFAFQAAYEYEGIDYTTPSANLQNTQQNVGNFSLINGVGGVQLIPGGGDATHGNTGTGLVAFQAKRGTYPATVGLDLETGLFPYNHQAGLEVSWADKSRRYSNYFSFIGDNQNFQYGNRGMAAALLGTRGANASTLNTLIDPNLVFYSPSDRSSRDFVDNFIVRLGKQQRQQLQFFYQGQAIHENLDYGGFGGLHYPSAGSGTGFQVGLCPQTPVAGNVAGVNSVLQSIACQKLIPLLPGQNAASDVIGAPDQLYSPYTAFKLEFSTPIGITFLNARVYRTISEQSQDLPSQGVTAPSFGGTRSGFSSEITGALGTHHTLTAGVKYEFSQPFGERFDATEYGAFTCGLQALQCASVFFNPLTLNGGQTAPRAIGSGIEADFLSPGDCATYFATAGVVNCGYLSRYFPNGARFPITVVAPTAKQQVFAAFIQDAMSIGAEGRLRIQPGLRLEGYNFLVPDDPLNPPSVPSFKHQRLYEPHFSISYRLTQRDDVKANFGHTLSVPLVSLLGTDVQRSAYAAFAGIPSYDSQTGQVAAYCGFNQHTICANYADQLYWLTRDLLYGSSSLSTPVKGASFTNLDFSYEHAFRNGTSFRITPFFRRGFDVIEQVASPTSYNPNTGTLVFGNAFLSNLGIQKATGVELLVSREVQHGLSALFGATFINQIGNEPPGAFLTPASLAAGTLYHSPDLSPFQATAALTYRSKGGLKINPVLSYNVGYPFGAGYLTQVYCGSIAGTPVNVPNTNLTSGVPGSNIGSDTPNVVDPENPGNCFHPNIAASRGVKEPASAGGFYSHPEYNLDMTVEYAPLRRDAGTFGLQVRNVFNQLFGVPVFNSCYGSFVATGLQYGSAPCALGTVATAPLSVSNGPYLVYPNRPPRTFNLYYQLHL